MAAVSARKQRMRGRHTLSILPVIMKVTWSESKNEELKSRRGRHVCFEDVADAIEKGRLLDEGPHPNSQKYPGQRLLVVLINGYVCAVPYVRTEDGIFLKTVFRSRRLNSQYGQGGPNGPKPDNF